VEGVFSSSIGIRYLLRSDFVHLKIERIPDNYLLGLHAFEITDFDKSLTGIHFRRKNQCMLVGCPFDEPEGSWNNIHLAVTNQNVTIASEPLYALILVNVVVVCIQEVAMTYHEVDDRIRVPVWLLGVTPEDVVYISTVMIPCRNLTVCIEARFPAWICESFQLIPVGEFNHAVVWIAISAPDFVIEANLIETLIEPILKMELFILTALSQNEFPLANSLHAALENLKDCHNTPPVMESPVKTEQHSRSYEVIYPNWGCLSIIGSGLPSVSGAT
jgi:hypothetical protein